MTIQSTTEHIAADILSAAQRTADRILETGTLLAEAVERGDRHAQIALLRVLANLTYNELDNCDAASDLAFNLGLEDAINQDVWVAVCCGQYCGHGDTEEEALRLAVANGASAALLVTGVADEELTMRLWTDHHEVGELAVANGMVMLAD